MKIKNRINKGFTLIELLVVVAIIGVLATIVMINVAGSKDKSRYARVLSDMEQVATAVRAYQAGDTAVYPNDKAGGLPPPELDSYLTDGWPSSPCAGYDYNYQNWGSCDETPYNTGAYVGVHYESVVGPSYKFYYNIKGMNKCDAWSQVGYDIKIKSPKEITCKEE